MQHGALSRQRNQKNSARGAHKLCIGALTIDDQVPAHNSTGWEKLTVKTKLNKSNKSPRQRLTRCKRIISFPAQSDKNLLPCITVHQIVFSQWSNNIRVVNMQLLLPRRAATSVNIRPPLPHQTETWAGLRPQRNLPAVMCLTRPTQCTSLTRGGGQTQNPWPANRSFLSPNH